MEQSATIQIANVTLLGNFRKGNPYLLNGSVIIPGGIYGDTEIKVQEQPQAFVCNLKTNDSGSYNGWQLHKLQTVSN